MSTVVGPWQPRLILGSAATRPAALPFPVAAPCLAARQVTNAVHRSCAPAPSRAGVPVPPQATSPRDPQVGFTHAEGTLAYDLIPGPNVKFSNNAAAAPTAVLVHGILGSRRNMRSFAKMLLKKMPSWQIVLVDLRCHGESSGRHDEDHSVESCATDVLNLLRELRLFPQVLIGHSFGGKVVMSMANQFGRRLPKKVQIWVLDSLPGEVRAGDGPLGSQDHPAELIETLRRVPVPFPRAGVAETLKEKGFSTPIVNWVGTNMVSEEGGGTDSMRWSFDLDGIADLYESYEETDLWSMVQDPPEGVLLNFVRAERSNFRWEGGHQENIEAHGHPVHLLQKSGHWVHVDNPVELADMIVESTVML